jgi:hypothetical protein
VDVFHRIEESEIKTARIRWRWGIGVAIVMMLIALFPQIYFALHRGHQWNGANAINHPDEVAYSAYVASLIRGNPRRYDPFTHRGAQNETSAPESLFSIQFIPPYAIALPAHWLRLSTSTVFIILPALCALASSFAIFWFVWLLTRDDRFSAASVPIIMGLGTLIAGQGIVRHVLNLPYLIPVWISNAVVHTSLYHLPFLRLYQPAVAFPLFFVLCALVWIALTRTKPRQSVAAAAGAGIAFVLLVFSYFFLWTAALAWLGSLCMIWLIFRSGERKRTLVVFGIILIFVAAAMVPYFRMLSHRAATVDAAQALVSTHRLDVFRFPEIIALLVLASLGLGILQRRFSRRDPIWLGAAAFALTVFVVFNQQVLTGRYLQPIHYEWFIGNYCALMGAVLVVGHWCRGEGRLRLTNKKLATVAVITLLWALAEVWLAASVSFDYNRAIDEGKPVADRLAQLEAGELTHLSMSVLVSDLRLADRFPTDAPQPVLWSPHMLIFPGVSEAENRERFWRQLYYLGYDEKKLWKELDHADWYFLAGLFPYDRLSPAVTGSQSPITPEEFRSQVAGYLDYVKTFNRDRAASPTLSYLVIHSDKQPDFTNLDRWYERDVGEPIGEFILYRVKLRP